MIYYASIVGAVSLATLASFYVGRFVGYQAGVAEGVAIGIRVYKE